MPRQTFMQGFSVGGVASNISVHEVARQNDPSHNMPLSSTRA